MKAYNLNSVKSVLIGSSEKDVLVLGEEGRGRKRTLVKCVKDIQDGNFVDLTIPKVGAPSITLASDQTIELKAENWLARISTEGAYIRGADGHVKANKDVLVISRGYGAFGDAGRTGNWDDLLLIIEDGTVLRVKPSRGDAYYLVFNSDSVERYSADEAEFEGISTYKEDYIRI